MQTTYINPDRRIRASTRKSFLQKEVIYIAKQLKLDLPIPEGYVLRFVAFITLKNGKRLYAKTCGIRAFPLVVKA